MQRPTNYAWLHHGHLHVFPLPQMRDVVRGLARQFPTAIISGRGREKVENFVQLKELYYAGSHGMDIAGPKVGSARLFVGGRG